MTRKAFFINYYCSASGKEGLNRHVSGNKFDSCEKF